jgi:hypothetical protein
MFVTPDFDLFFEDEGLGFSNNIHVANRDNGKCETENNSNHCGVSSVGVTSGSLTQAIFGLLRLLTRNN